MLVRLYTEGAADAEVCKAVRMSYEDFEKRCQNDGAFAQLVDYGRLAAKAWWLELGRKAAAGQNKAQFNFWYAVMKNRYGWSDKMEVGEGEKPITQMSQDEIIMAITRKKDALAKLLNANNVTTAIFNSNESNANN
jgi:hypothetical protein